MMALLERDNRSSAVAATWLEADTDPAWDKLIAGTVGGDFVQTSLWAMTRKRLGFQVYQAMVTDAWGSSLGGCMVYVKRVAPGISVASIPRGPMMFTDRPEAVAMVAYHVVSLARRHGIRALVVQVPEGQTALDLALADLGFRHGVSSIAPEATVRFDPRRSDEELMACMSSKRRAALRRALRNNFEVRRHWDVPLFHRLHAMTAERQGFLPVSLENLQAQADILASTGNCAMFTVSYDGVPVTGSWLTCFAGTVTAKLAGWDADSPAPRGASEVLRWATVQWAREQGAHTYDLGGFDRRTAERLLAGEPPGDWCQEGVTGFKLSMGSLPVLLPRARFAYTQRLTNLALGSATQRFLTSRISHKIAQRLRNG